MEATSRKTKGRRTAEMGRLKKIVGPPCEMPTDWQKLVSIIGPRDHGQKVGSGLILQFSEDIADTPKKDQDQKLINPAFPLHGAGKPER
jgi:hypothetical protein